MSLRSIDIYHVAVPLKMKIRHASHERVTSDNLVVRATLDDGHVGYGEGVPRSYVTGETIETAFATLARFDTAQHLGRPRDYAEVVRRLDELRFPETEADPRGMAGNAARCALELAILDAYGRRFGQSLGQAIPLVDAPGLVLRPRPGWVRYSGAITAETPRRERKAAWMNRIFGFKHVKVKVGVAGQDDPARLAQLRRILGKRMDLRIDANEAWPASVVVERVRPLLAAAPSALEQPVPHAEVDALAEIRPRLGVPVMLDESLCGYPDATRAIERGTADLFNVRLSKCGGIVPTLADRRPGPALGSRASARLSSGRDGPALGGGTARRQPGPGVPLGRGLVRPPRPGREPDDPGRLVPAAGLRSAARRARPRRRRERRGARADDGAARGGAFD